MTKDPRTRRHNEQFGLRLLQAREGLNKTQEEMGQLLGMTEDRYKKAEQGKRGFPPEFIQTLCAITRKDANFFFHTAAAEQKRTGS